MHRKSERIFILNDTTKLLLIVTIILVSGVIVTLSGWIFSESIKREHGLKAVKYCNTWTGLLAFVIGSNLMTQIMPFVAALLISIAIEILGLNHGYRAVALTEEAKYHKDDDLE